MRRSFVIPFLVLLALAGPWSALPSLAGPPRVMSYSGRLFQNDVPYTGTAYFKFAMVVEGSVSLWSNDGTSTTGNEPVASVAVPVDGGVFTVLLGDADLGMQPLEPDFFAFAPTPMLRIWVDTGTGFEQLDDAPVASSLFAVSALTANRSLGDFLVEGVVHTLGGIRFPDDTVQTTAATGSGGPDGDWTIAGSNMYSAVAGNVGIGTASPSEKLHVAGDILSTSMLVKNSGWTDAFLSGDATYGGRLELHGPDGPTDYGITMISKTASGGAVLDLYDGSGAATVELLGNNGNGGSVVLGNGTQATVYVDGNTNGGGQFRATNNAGTITYQVLGQAYAGGSQTNMIDINGDLSQQWTAANREWKVYDDVGTVQIRAFGQTSGGELSLYQKDGQSGVILDGDNGGDGEIKVYDSSGAVSVQIVGEDGGGNGRVITDVLEITGGADLSEQFDVTGRVEPGMTVCIDAANPGQLALSCTAYDRKVAGIVSGAGGVKTGMLMGQKGTMVDGKHPVALSGRVWAWCDAESHAIEPGDFLTTSSTPGHAMKATDHERAQGAILGKAMTSLQRGRGLVLVLVNPQ